MEQSQGAGSQVIAAVNPLSKFTAWICHSAEEQDAAVPLVADGKHAGVVGTKENGGGSCITAAIWTPTIAVAAAASVPSSFTSTNALWTTSEKLRSRRPSMPEKSAASVEGTLMPRPASLVFIRNDASILNLGR